MLYSKPTRSLIVGFIVVLLLLPFIQACAGDTKPKAASPASIATIAPTETAPSAATPTHTSDNVDMETLTFSVEKGEKDGEIIPHTQKNREVFSGNSTINEGDEGVAMEIDDSEESAEIFIVKPTIRENSGAAVEIGDSEESAEILVVKPTIREDSGAAMEEPPLDATVASAPAIPRPQGRPAVLKAGERDDNDLFEEYLAYLASYRGKPVIETDVRERYIITVLGQNQQPLLDADVHIYSGEQHVFEGRTYAGGQTLFHPTASSKADSFRLVASYGESRNEQIFQRGQQEYLEIILEDAFTPSEMRLDVLFLLDTTGSMDDELNRVQETIDSIAQRIDTFVPRPISRFGVVAYRDRGDEYITRSYDFTEDVETFRKLLNSFTADGGGDTPESLNEALHEAIHNLSWENNAVRLVFLIADAGPHLDYENDYDYISETKDAVARGIKIYPIAASNTDDQAEYVFRQIAQQTMARFIFLTYQSGEQSGVPGETTALQSGDQPYTVDKLDDLIVQVVQRELAAARGYE